MKYIGFILLLLAQTATAQTFEINGTVLNKIRPFIIIQTHNPFSGVIKKDTVILSNDGSFSAFVSDDRPFYNFTLNIDSLKSIELIGLSGGKMTLEIKPNTKPAIIGGNLQRVAQFRDVEQAYFKKIYDEYHKRNPLLERSDFQRTDAYFLVHDSITLERINFMKTHFSVNTLDIEKRFIKYYEWNYLASDLFYKQSYNNAPAERIQFIAQRLGKQSDNYYRFSNYFNIDNNEFTFVPGYQRLIYSMLLAEISKRRASNNEIFSYYNTVQNALSIINELTRNESTRINLKLLFITAVTDELDRNKNTKDLESLLPLLLSLDKPTKNKNYNELKERINTILIQKKFAKGSLAPQFTVYDVNENKIQLSDFKGKKIIIDISASWCGPCIAYIPTWNKRVDENKDPNTIFVYLSIDNTKEEWIQFRKRHPAKGIQLFAGNGGFKSPFAITYEISMLPNQIIIDENGLIESYSFK